MEEIRIEDTFEDTTAVDTEDIDTEEEEEGFNPWLIGGGAIGAAVLGYLGYRVFKKKHNKDGIVDAEIVEPEKKTEKKGFWRKKLDKELDKEGLIIVRKDEWENLKKESEPKEDKK